MSIIHENIFATVQMAEIIALSKALKKPEFIPEKRY